jgi:phosphoglycolate phosphatase-like HAD superfamily hydrolase
VTSLRCVVFDFDGVLVDSNKVKHRAYFELFEPLGPEASTLVAEVLARGGERDRYDVLRAIVRRASEAGLMAPAEAHEALVKRYADAYNEICEEHVATCAEIPGASVTLPRLAERYALYINSSTPDDPLSRIVARRGWTLYFRGVYGSASGKADNLARVARLEGIDPGEGVFVGDSEVDQRAAGAQGWHFIAVENEHNDFVESPPRRCADLLEVDSAIGEL